MLSCVDLSRVLEIGCGEGNVIPIVKGIRPGCHYVAADIDVGLLKQAEVRGADETWLIDPAAEFAIPHEDRSFSAVLMVEVLEHVPNPHRMLSESIRVSSAHLIASVPNEPVWRILNIMRFRYWSRLGNTPGHINHWGSRDFRMLLSSHSAIEQFSMPFPWLMALCRTPSSGT